jgi:hypothetical protein
LFYPGSIAVIGFYSAKPTTADLLYWMLVMACFVLLPLVFLGIFIKKGYADSLHLPNPKQRNGLYFISVFSAFPALFYFHQNALKTPFVWGLCVVWVLLLLWLLNRFVLKASAHLAAATGLLIFTVNTQLPVFPWQTMAGILLPALYFSRRGLNAHTHSELWAGVAAGVVGVGLVM